MKLLLMGAPLAGKSTLARYLRATEPKPNIVDFDEETLKLSGGVWPAHNSYRLFKNDSHVYGSVMTSANIIFMTYEQPLPRIKRARKLGFTVVQLIVPFDELNSRNNQRLIEQPDNDAFQFVTENLEQQDRSFKAGLVDFRVDGTLPTKTIAETVMHGKQVNLTGQ